ncbi:MAG: choice-of-anchor I family protein [Alphaproteobacteria bacterium]|nr:choice-of-anchor I family protein [Alphaproteobacteria bacterium]MBU0797275.1 choice-of-anchor I family protein [Alphaproteobacteria bacterium]MBU0888937.1 choice-of-anchor I family protein [Alphaproteobacteria bacterium]MBU1813957.1 choice-of-anchor I family protein [Alphaproteobacteria bacterium]
MASYGNQLGFTTVWTTDNSASTAGTAEIVAIDPASGRLFSVGGGGVDVMAGDTGAILFGIDTSAFGNATSVAVKNGVVAIAVAAADKTDPGTVRFYDTNGNFLRSATVGANPDMVTFTPDGTRVLIANEGEPSDNFVADPIGSIAIVTVATGAVTIAGFEAFESQQAALKAEGLRIYGQNASFMQDLEPEYIAVSSDGTRAYVTLQENNAIAVVDLTTNSVVDILPLGFKDHSVAGNGIDASDRDGINIVNVPVYGMYQPDAIAAYDVGSTTYLVMANEGDAREWGDFVEETRIKDMVLDPTAFPNAAALQTDEGIGRLNATNKLGDTDSDGDFDEIYVLGGRSFTIRDTAGNIVFDSGDQIEQIIAERFPELWVEDRSDSKGPEPEGLVVGQVGNATMLFLALERTDAIMVWNITDPNAPSFVDMIRVAGTDAPEGLAFISASDSATGNPMLAIAYEDSGNTVYYEIKDPTNLGNGGVTFTVTNAGGELVNGGSGNDVITGGGGNDTIFGGAGADTIEGGEGADRLDIADNTGNGNALQGNRGADTVAGGAGNDELRGGKGFDQLTGGAGNDTLFGGQGGDTLTGGNGADAFVIDAQSGADVITDFTAGSDVIQLTVTVAIADLVASATDNADGNAIITVSAGNTITLQGIAAADVTAEFFALV